MKGASAVIISYALFEWVARHDQRSALNNRTGAPDIGHPDLWIVDDIIFYQQFIFNERVSHHAHQRADGFDFPEFYCGVITLSPDILEDCELSGKEMMEQLAPMLPALSRQQRYLPKTMGTGVPLLPVHMTEEKLLYGEVQRKLRRKIGVRPLVGAISVAFNRVVDDDWLRRPGTFAAADGAAPKDDGRKLKKTTAKAVKMEQPALFFKLTSHMVAYQAFYNRTQNEASPIFLCHPDRTRTSAAASNSATADFGLDATAVTPVASRSAPRRRTSPVAAQQRAGVARAGQCADGVGATKCGHDAGGATGTHPETVASLQVDVNQPAAGENATTAR